MSPHSRVHVNNRRLTASESNKYLKEALVVKMPKRKRLLLLTGILSVIIVSALLFNPIHPLIIYSPLSFLVPADIMITAKMPPQLMPIAESLNSYDPPIAELTFDTYTEQKLYNWASITYHFVVLEGLDRARHHRAPLNPNVIVYPITVNYTMEGYTFTLDADNLTDIFNGKPPWSWLELQDDGTFYPHFPFLNGTNKTQMFEQIYQYLRSFGMNELVYVRQYWFSLAQYQFVLVFDRAFITDLDGNVLFASISSWSLCGLAPS